MLFPFRGQPSPKNKNLREPIFERRGRDVIDQFETLRLNQISSEDIREELTSVERVYSMGDKLYKYSYEFYGSVEYWWVIAWYNNRPTDTHCKIGDTIHIPMPLEKAIILATRER